MQNNPTQVSRRNARQRRPDFALSVPDMLALVDASVEAETDLFAQACGLAPSLASIEDESADLAALADAIAAFDVSDDSGVWA